MSRATEDTIAALATPAGTAALAVIRVSGADTARLAAAIFGAVPPPRRARHLVYREQSGAELDEVVAVFYPAPHSYTAEDVLEISCHGNPFIAQRMLEDLYARGCRPAGPGEFTQRAFFHGRIDLSQAEAVMDVIHARSERALTAAHQQLRGALGRRIQAAVDQLVDLLARIEAYIDFPEEDLPAEDRAGVVAALARLRGETSRLLATSHYGAMLRDGIKTVILGPPNAGKSSLLNRLVGRERALVSPEPGTTRDFIEERIVVGPHCLRLIDTAGLNPTPAAIERLGIEKTIERADEADLFLLVQEVGGPSPSLPAGVRDRIRPGNAIVVVNKIDLPRSGGAVTADEGVVVVSCSALTGDGIDDLVAAIIRLADAQTPLIGDDAIAVSARHAHALQEAGRALATAEEKVERHDPTELVASDLRGALDAFGEIRGRVDNEEMLDRLFATFCIGK